ncbi:MAG: cellulose synthase family protein [Planctomycetota bacterium]|jgi:cellulose synthase/poly-beta-1,6-N-acetylglucosamine synthase-like glycosyltransferase
MVATSIPEGLTTLIVALYWIAVGGLCLYGINCYVLCRAFRRNSAVHFERLARQRETWRVAASGRPPPFVTVQLPVYNERFVVERLLRAVAEFDYPRDRFEIQVLDDSTDDTSSITARVVTELVGRGLEVSHLRRSDRKGYKAGALRDGMARARGEFIAIFDADFLPDASFLQSTVPFFTNPDVGLVQTRWGHLNREHSALTRAQGLAIDGHFGIEQAGRCWSGWLLNFNGTAGIWRRKAIEDAGGWQADTLTEDLDLSYRAQLAGWRIEYAADVEVPAEIPADITAFKSQQRRWAKGSIQTAKKLLPRVWRSGLPLTTRIQATLHLTHYLVHPLMLLVALLAAPVLLSGRGMPLSAPTFALAAALLLLGTCGPTTLYITAQRALRTDWRKRLVSLPVLMLIGTGIAVSNTRAVLEALAGVDSAFVRTPKRSMTDANSARSPTGYKLPLDTVFVVEAAAAAYSAWGLSLYLQHGRWLIGPFLALYTLGFTSVALLSLREALRGLRRGRLGEVLEATGTGAADRGSDPAPALAPLPPKAVRDPVA